MNKLTQTLMIFEADQSWKGMSSAFSLFFEAMSMELPVIVTNSSGPTAYMTDANSYPLRSDGLEEGTGFATPSRQHLQSLMRHAVAEPAEGHAKGRQARRDLESAFTPAHVSMLLMNHLKDLVSGG